MFYHHQEIWRVCSYLTHATAVKVANTMVMSRLDYCNSLLFHTRENIYGLKIVQKALCLIVCKQHKFNHVTPFVHTLAPNSVLHAVSIQTTCESVNFMQHQHLFSVCSVVILHLNQTKEMNGDAQFCSSCSL